MADKEKDNTSKEQLLSKLLEGVKACQSRFGSRTELATEDDESVRKLCIVFEDVFLHGIKTKGPEKGRSLWQMTENLVPSSLRLPLETPSFWPMIKSQLSKHESERFLLLHNVRNDFGRSRAWLRSALNEHSLERYIHIFLSLDNLQNYYETWAFLRDPELSAILPQTAAGLGSVLFALVVENPALDSCTRPTASKQDIVASPVEVAEVADQFLSAMKDKETSDGAKEALSPTQNQRHNLKKKKKKPHLNVVSFDDEGNETKMTPDQPFHSSISSPPSSSASNRTTPTPTPTPTPSSKILASSFCSSPVQILPKSQSRRNEQVHPEVSIYSSSVKSMDCVSMNSVYSDCSERLDIENMNLDLRFGNISPSQRLKPVRDRTQGTSGGESNNFDPNNESDLDSSSQDLIPLPNFDPGSATAPELHTADELLDLDQSFITSPLTTPSESTKNTKVSTPRNANVTLDSGNTGSNEERITKLKAILDREIESVATLQAKIAEEKRKSMDQIKILEARAESLGKDNEILKHQLNKYIGAVQLLKKERGQPGMRRGSSFEEYEHAEILSQVGAENNKHDTGTSDEGAEYERKLIQVAEMHGELMEFNSHLQTILRRKDLAIRRLKEELVDLRGPLAAPLLNEDNTTSGFDDESWDIVDSGNSYDGGGRGSPSRRHIHLTHNERVLINIWIPSAFLTGANTDLHHVYQVFIRIKDTEWNVYRRYSQFYSFHRDLKKRDSVIGSFYFPPKKHLGNKDGKFVDERRRKLQDYLRKVINHNLQTNSILAAHPDKNLLISSFPFFGENTFVHQKKKEQQKRSARNLFFLSSSHNNEQQQVMVHQQTQQYPQYTGL